MMRKINNVTNSEFSGIATALIIYLAIGTLYRSNYNIFYLLNMSRSNNDENIGLKYPKAAKNI
jgi:hypothetical protein